MQILKNLRKNKHYTQEALADFLECTPTTYGRYEKGTRDPDLATLCKLADFFEVTVDYLLGREQTSLQQLPPEQAELLRIYEVLPPSQKQGLVQIVKMYASLSPTMQKNSLIYFRTLAGFKKAVDEGIISDRDMLDL